MLVLALQFSKGSERGRMRNDYLTHTTLLERGSLAESVVQGTPRAAGANAPCHRRGSTTRLGRLPQNGREDKARRAGVSRGRILRLTCHFDLPTNAPTGSGSNRVGRMPTND
jgi:hypothetical protein